MGNNGRVPTPTHASQLTPVECHAGGLEKLAPAGEQFNPPRVVGHSMDRAATFRSRERRRRGKMFRDTVRKDRRRRAKCSIWIHPGCACLRGSFVSNLALYETRRSQSFTRALALRHWRQDRSANKNAISSPRRVNANLELGQSSS